MKRLVCILTVAALLLTAGCARSAGNGAAADVTEGVDNAAPEATYTPVRAGSLTPLSAKSAKGEAVLTVSKNFGGQETGLTWWILLPFIAEGERTSVEVTIPLPEGCTVDEAKCNGLLGVEGDVYTLDLSVWRAAITVSDGESSREWVFRFMEEGE